MTQLLGIRIGLGQFVILLHEQECTVHSLIICGQSFERNPVTLRSGRIIQVESPVRWDLDRDSFVNALVVVFETLDLKRLDPTKQSLKGILLGSALGIVCLHGICNASGGTIGSNQKVASHRLIGIHLAFSLRVGSGTRPIDGRTLGHTQRNTRSSTVIELIAKARRRYLILVMELNLIGVVVHNVFVEDANQLITRKDLSRSRSVGGHPFDAFVGLGTRRPVLATHHRSTHSLYFIPHTESIQRTLSSMAKANQIIPIGLLPHLFVCGRGRCRKAIEDGYFLLGIPLSDHDCRQKTRRSTTNHNAVIALRYFIGWRFDVCVSRGCADRERPMQSHRCSSAYMRRNGRKRGSTQQCRCTQ